MYRTFFISLVGGLKLNIHEWDGEGAACLLIHGLAEGSFVWDNFANELAPRFRVIAIDLRGHGNSDWDPEKNYNMDTHVADINNVLDQLNLRKYIVIGHSLGGCLAAKILDQRPEEVLAAVIVDTGPTLNQDIDKYVYEQILEDYRDYKCIDEFLEKLREKRFLAHDATLACFARNALICKQLDQYSPKFDIAVAASVLEQEDTTWWWSALARSRMPILIVRGRASAILPQQVACKMAKTAPKGELAVIELAGHSVMVDNPSGFSNAVKSFILFDP